MPDKITADYLCALQGKYNKIADRGICINMQRLEDAKVKVDEDIQKNLKIAADQWHCHVYIGAANDDGTENSVNLNATQGDKALLKKMQNLGYEVPKIVKKNQDGDYERKFSTGELALQKMLVANQFNFNGGDPAIRAILRVRELGKIKSSYLSALLFRQRDGNRVYLSSYNVAGTVTGRRSSKKHSFNFGNNAQNFPKHGSISKVFRRCLVPRPGNIFLMVDQKGAEEWPVLALSKNTGALLELQNGLNRHLKRAAFLFNLDLSTKSESEWKDGMEYYLGKKTGHAKNYGMRGNRMSDSLAQEGYSINPKQCQLLLDRLGEFDPSIEGVFHVYIQDRVNRTRILETPFGRQRQFLGLRPRDANYSIFNESYSYIPQSVVGDNTGFAVFHLETVLPPEKRAIVQEGHDSIVQDIPDDLNTIYSYLCHTANSFDRKIKFHNGIEIQIPVEAEIGYDFADTVKLKDMSFDALKIAYEKLKTKN